jgi:nickel/cobalt transporter (NicO) family protein
LSLKPMRPTLASALLVLAWITPGLAHDIPNARVDRSIQATIGPSKLRVDYEVSLAELTLIQDLRQLGGEVPGGDRRAWFEQYGKVTGPLNAKGFLVVVDGQEVDAKFVGFDLTVEGHPRFTFHFEAAIPESGRLLLNDTNYLASEGTSRLALRPVEGVEVRGDDLPVDVSRIEIKPVWQLNDAQERRTRRLTVDYSRSIGPSAIQPIPEPVIQSRPTLPPIGLSQLLDRAAGRAWPALLLAALVLGAAHAIQPGHGKTVVAASSLGRGGGPFRGALLGLATATVHMASVALIALALWVTRSRASGEIHLTLARLAGFVIAAIGLWRFGRHLAGFGEHGHPVDLNAKDHSSRRLIPLALAGGIVPCWDAVALVLVSEALGRLPLGLALLGAFSLGMASVLVLVGLAAGRFRASVDRFDPEKRWERRLGILGGLILAAIGLSMMGN